MPWTGGVMTTLWNIEVKVAIPVEPIDMESFKKSATTART